MRLVFGVLFGALLLLSLVVWQMQPSAAPEGKTLLVRVSDDNPVRQAQVDLFNKLHPKLHLVLDPSTADTDKVIVQSLGGVGPDLFDCFDPFQLSAYVEAGIAWDVTDELAKRGIDLNRDVFPGILPTAVRDGRAYGVPTNIAVDAVWFHRDLFAKYNIPIHRGPWSWAEFIPIAERLTERDANGRPIRFGFLFDWWQWPSFFKGFGAHVYSPDGTRCTVDSPQGIAAVQLMYDLVYKYKVSGTPAEEASITTAGGFGSGTISMFGSKRAAMALGGRWWLQQLGQYPGIRIGVMESPNGGVRRFHAYGRATLINVASPHREAALQYLLFQTEGPYNRLISRQADGIPAFKKYAQGPPPSSLDPNPGDFEIWKQITSMAAADDVSEFVNGQEVSQIMTDQLDLVQGNEKTAAVAMRDAAVQVNALIQKNVSEDPKLRAKFERHAQAGRP